MKSRSHTPCVFGSVSNLEVQKKRHSNTFLVVLRRGRREPVSTTTTTSSSTADNSDDSDDLSTFPMKRRSRKRLRPVGEDVDTDSRSNEPGRPPKMPKAEGTKRDTASPVQDLTRMMVIVKFEGDSCAGVIFPLTDCSDGDALNTASFKKFRSLLLHSRGNIETGGPDSSATVSPR